MAWVWDALRFSTLLAPQIALSAAALWAFHTRLFFPPDLGWVHLPLVVAIQAVFFAGWGYGAPRGGWANRRVARTYATALFVKSFALNAVYFLSFAANRFWGDNFTWANLGSTGKHLMGFHAAFGAIVFWAAGGMILLVALWGFALFVGAPAQALRRPVGRHVSVHGGARDDDGGGLRSASRPRCHRSDRR